MTIKQLSVFVSRIALFVIYIWFGVLKVIGQSPASPLVRDLCLKTLPFIPPANFIVLFGLFEIAIGILFIIPRWEKLAFILFAVHMFTTVLPLFLLGAVWTHPFVPTLEGQYIIKNLALIACALTIAGSLTPKENAPIPQRTIDEF